MPKIAKKETIIMVNENREDVFMTSVDGEKKCFFKISNDEMYSSLETFAELYNLDYNSVVEKFNNGILLKDCIETAQKAVSVKPTVGGYRESTPVEFRGKTYKSLNAFAMAFNLSPSLTYSRYVKGWTLAEIVIGYREDEPIILHGQMYTSFAEIARVYNMDYKFLTNRLYRGWSLEAAVETPKGKSNRNVEYMGTVYKSSEDLCKQLDISHKFFKKKKSFGWSIEKIVSSALSKKEKQKATA